MLTPGIFAWYFPQVALCGIIALVRPWQGGGWRPGAAAAAVLLAAFLVPVVPWTIRNFVSLDRFVPISTGGGKALYVGTDLSADGDYQRVKAELVKRYDHRDLAPNSPQLNHINPTPLFDRVARQHGYPGTNRDAALGKAGRSQLSDDLRHHTFAYVAMLARKTGRAAGV